MWEKMFMHYLIFLQLSWYRYSLTVTILCSWETNINNSFDNDFLLKIALTVRWTSEKLYVEREYTQKDWKTDSDKDGYSSWCYEVHLQVEANITINFEVIYMRFTIVIVKLYRRLFYDMEPFVDELTSQSSMYYS